MRLLTPKGHVVAQINNTNFIVDTGSPCSFNYCGLSSIDLNGKSYASSNFTIAPKGTADQLTGLDISGFIGTDILFKTGLTVDYENNDISFSVPENIAEGPEFYYMPIELYLGQYIVTDRIILGNHIQRAIIDTGAFISYVSSRHLENLSRTDECYEDANPICGKIYGNYYIGNISFNSNTALLYNYPVKVGEMPPLLNVLGLFDAVVGPDLLSRKLLIFDFENHRIGMKYDGRETI